MRVGIVISTYRRTGGLERVAVEWSRGLAARGHDVVVFAQSVSERDAGIEFVPVGGASRPNWLRAATFPSAAARAVRANPVDVLCSFGASVLAPSVMGTAGPHRAWFEQGIAETKVFSSEGLRRRLNPHHRIVMAMERKIFGGGVYERVFATSLRSAADYARLYGVDAAVLPNGVNMEEFRFDAATRERVRNEWDAAGRWVVLTIANEVARKGVDVLVRAFAHVRKQSPEALLVVGGPLDGSALRGIARAAGVESDVRLIGPVAEPSAAYGAADLFAFPTRYDPWGLVAIEALACGTPVVCAAAAGVAGQIQPGRTGILAADVRDERALATEILAARGIDATREECRASVSHLSWDRIADRVEEVLREVVAGRAVVRS